MLLVVLAAAALLAGCFGGGDDESVTLLDGSPAGEVLDLEGVDGDVVVTSQLLEPTEALDQGSKTAACLAERFQDTDPGPDAVVRTGLRTETVTFHEAGGRAVLGCSNSPGPREKGRWCGSSYGQLRNGALTDPRLDMGCRARDGTPIGFVWVDAGEGTQYVAVAQPDYTEVYEVAGGLPIRIATVNGVDVETSSATFEISEHDAEGRRLRERTLEAFVAG
jgi:hypothetical protein